MEQHKRCVGKLSDNPRYLTSINQLSAVLECRKTHIIHSLIYNINCVRSSALATLAIKQQLELISVVRLSLDLLQAGSTLPRGYLWGGKLDTWHVGLIGTVSAFIGIYQMITKKHLAKQ